VHRAVFTATNRKRVCGGEGRREGRDGMGGEGRGPQERSCGGAARSLSTALKL